MKQYILTCKKCGDIGQQFYGTATCFRTEYFNKEKDFIDSGETEPGDEYPDEFYCNECNDLADEIEVEVEPEKDTSGVLFK